MQIQETLDYALFRVTYHLRLELERRLAKLPDPVTPEQWVVLFTIKRFPGSSQQKIVQEAHKDKASIAKIMKGLERRKLLQRKRDYQDRRNYKLFLTAAGSRLEKEASLINKALRTSMLSEVSEVAQLQAVKVLDAIYQKLAADNTR